MNPKVDWFFEKETPWQNEYQKLREIVLACELTEELKWGVPCYTFKEANVVLIHGFKNYCALLFHKGVLLNDADHILIQQTEHVQAARQIRFSSLQEIIALASTLKTYIYEAIEVERAGLKVAFKEVKAFPIPEEFQQKTNTNSSLKAAFEALTPGRQRAYLLYFSQAKHAKTREARVEKYIPKILSGKGLHD